MTLYKMDEACRKELLVACDHLYQAFKHLGAALDAGSMDVACRQYLIDALGAVSSNFSTLRTLHMATDPADVLPESPPGTAEAPPEKA